MTFTKGDLVHDISDKDRVGKVVTPGVQVSEVRWPDKVTTFVGNEYLRRVK